MAPLRPWSLGLLLGLGCAGSPRTSPPTTPPSHLELGRGEARELLCRSLALYDCDGDTRITVLDAQTCPEAMERPITLPDGTHHTFRHLHQRSQWAEALARIALASDDDEPRRLAWDDVLRNPAETLLHRIEHEFWEGLTRVIEPDAAALRAAASDTKFGSDPPELALCHAPPREGTRAEPEPLHVYVPATDAGAWAAFAPLASDDLAIHRLTLPLRPDALSTMTRTGTHGLLSLGLDERGHGRPFVVPGGRFNELYGWDSHFIALGLLHAPTHVPLARAMVDNLAYEIEHYGKVLNANRTYYLTRSQPPLLAATTAAVAAHLPRDATTAAWRRRAMEAAIREYETWWNASPRRSAVCDGDVCLARFAGTSEGEPPEVEPGHFAWFYQHYTRVTGACTGADGSPVEQREFIACAAAFGHAYRTGDRQDPAVDTFFAHDRAMRESGHDTTYRWFRADDPVPDRAGDFVTVDLNALLLRAELEIVRWLREDTAATADHDPAAAWCARAEARARLMRAHLYDPELGLFFDATPEQRSDHLAATTLYPLWATADDPCGVDLLSSEERTRLVREALRRLEAPGGLLATDPAALARVQRPIVLRDEGETIATEPLTRQWEAPYGWAPHQMLAWEGLAAHGFEEDAERLVYRWLYTIVRNAADYHGTVPEKYDVVARSHRVFAEYGNVNSEFAYIATEGFGWMNASFVVGWSMLSPAARADLAADEGPVDRFGPALAER